MCQLTVLSDCCSLNVFGEEAGSAACNEAATTELCCAFCMFKFSSFPKEGSLSSVEEASCRLLTASETGGESALEEPGSVEATRGGGRGQGRGCTGVILMESEN